MADDLYEGFGDGHLTALAVGVPAAGLTTSYGKPRVAQPGATGLGTGTSRASDPSSQESVRPMTSKKGAGYTSAGRRPSATVVGGSSSFDPLNQGKRYEKPRTDTSIEDQIKALEPKIYQLLDESYMLSDSRTQLDEALTRAKEAYKKDRQIGKLREQLKQQQQSTNGDGAAAGGNPSGNLDLTYCVLLNLANRYHDCKMYAEAISTYSSIVKSKQFNQSGRLRVNIGNVYFEQQNYAMAVKMYRMALDQLSTLNQKLRTKILRNIGVASIRSSEFQDAVQAFQTIMELDADHATGYNLLLCHYALGDRREMQRIFEVMVSLPLPSLDVHEEHDAIAPSDDHNVFMEDSLRALDRDRKKSSKKYIAYAARLISPVLGETPEEGFQWVLQCVKGSPASDIADELEIGEAIYFLKEQNFVKATEHFCSFEKKDSKMTAVAATNLSFIHGLEGDQKQAERFANVAIQGDRYNAKAINNLGNVHFVHGDYDNARLQYMEALGIDAECVEAVFNAGLTSKKSGLYETAIPYFQKLNSMLTDNAEVIYQLADIVDKLGDTKQAMQLYKRLLSVAPTDPEVLASIAEGFQRAGDKAQAFHYFSESCRYLPSNLDVLAWLGAYYVESEVYEQALIYFERAAVIQPTEIKWMLMLASCYRRSGNYPLSFEAYKAIHRLFPENSDCLRFLVRVCTDMGLTQEAQEYIDRLMTMEKNQVDPSQQAMVPAALSEKSRSSAGDSAAASSPNPIVKPKANKAVNEEQLDWNNEDIGDLLAF